MGDCCFGLPMAVVIVWRLIAQEKYLSANLPGHAECREKARYQLIPWIY